VILDEHRYGALALPVNFLVLTAGSALLGRGSALPPAFVSEFFVAHALTTFSAYACFFLSFVLSIMYVTQHRQIKDRQLGPLFQRLPALSIMDDSVMRIDAVGAGLLLFGIVAGGFWIPAVPGDFEIPVAKIIFAVLTLTIYCTELGLRIWRGKRGIVPCVISMLGFLFVLFTLSVGSHGY
jgi:HemX protein